MPLLPSLYCLIERGFLEIRGGIGKSQTLLKDLDSNFAAALAAENLAEP